MGGEGFSICSKSILISSSVYKEDPAFSGRVLPATEAPSVKLALGQLSHLLFFSRFSQIWLLIACPVHFVLSAFQLAHTFSSYLPACISSKPFRVSAGAISHKRSSGVLTASLLISLQNREMGQGQPSFNRCFGSLLFSPTPVQSCCQILFFSSSYTVLFRGQRNSKIKQSEIH